MKTLNIKNVLLGQGKPKICVPIVAMNLDEIKHQINLLKGKSYDLIEFRADYFKDIKDVNKLIKAIFKIKENTNKPILFTFRSFEEGGNLKFSDDFYFKLNDNIIDSNLIDIIDIELNKNESQVKSIIQKAHKNNIKVLMSSHDFRKTLQPKEIISRLINMENLGADITKVAISAKSAEDVLTILNVTNDMKSKHATKPFVIIAMNGVGAISRICGELFGSCLTFASLEKSSAPGQIEINNLNEILNTLHNQLTK